MQKRKVGRPVKPKQKFFSVDASSLVLSETAQRLAVLLPNCNNRVIKDLAAVSISFNLMMRVQKNCSLAGRGRGRRAMVHVASLYAECALVNERHTGACAQKTLSTMGGWEEESRQSSHTVPTVEKYATAILTDAGIRLVSSKRQQIRNGLKYLGISPLFHAVTT
jgi:hypothetical protein